MRSLSRHRQHRIICARDRVKREIFPATMMSIEEHQGADLLSEQGSTSALDNVQGGIHLIGPINHHRQLGLLCQGGQRNVKACKTMRKDLYVGSLGGIWCIFE